ncbi:urea ABC transporter permease subunit UrtB [Algicella marina]|uniref:Urea ABC transporter permease subunit UrtB n=1 Tax=Algicella marina TaxID=2683284 RepID=A0A6P1T5T6_9RHOB|nr:urea ABC transporter permease subunit UrtB [Algicella marina]QHQ36816.1 urea ABC transporter permease subunit UrtB [Algicella marina]
MLFRALILCFAFCASIASAQSFSELAAQLPEGDYDDRAAVIADIAATGDPAAVPLLEALAEGDLQTLKADGRLVRVTKENKDTIAFDAVTGERIGEIGRRDGSKVRVNNSLRRSIRAALGILTLRDANPFKRLEAANAAFKAADPEQLEALRAAREAEENPGVASALDSAIAAVTLVSDEPTEAKIEAIALMRTKGDQDALSVLTPLMADDELGDAATKAVTAIERAQQFWTVGQNVWYGLSLGSVLLLAAIGLAITFGVMGVINMAHGELVMLGAYTTFFVQEIIRNSAPELFGYSLAIAAPLAFLVAGGVGVGIERGVVRFLYGRPLETLLATWGISLILQQTVRSIFGPNNREVGNPQWMSGAFEVGQLTITYNRLWILVFALIVFFGLLLVLKRTPLGLQMRAVTQNRAMAANMGIRTGWVDAMTFGLGAGIAGLAGVALSQIDNVSPNLGQSYIVDSFMVVVFGGAGNLWGALAGAFSLGIANKFLEPYTGAVLAKILVLVAIILFIQKRPRGLFAVRGRAVEA